MDDSMNTGVRGAPPPSGSLPRNGPAYQAYQILLVGFSLLPILAGLDKFVGIFTNWDQYLAPQIARSSPVGAHNLMMIVGVIEIVAGVGVVVKPRIFGVVVAAWLWAIIVNLLLIPSYLDIALRDLGLSLGALALSRLARAFERGRP